MRLDSSIKDIKGIGDKTSKLLNSVGVYTVGDILLYFPRDYERYPEPCTLDQAVVGRKCAVFLNATKQPSLNPRSKMNTALLEYRRSDGSLFRFMWFRSPYVRNLIRPGYKIILYGNVIEKNGIMYMDQPAIYEPGKYMDLMRSLQPVYSLTKGLSNNLLTKSIDTALSCVPADMEYLSEKIKADNNLCDYSFALKNMHFPESEDDCIKARRRFVFDEFFFFIMAMQMSKDQTVKQNNSFEFKSKEKAESFIKNMPYKLTNAQQKALNEILTDMSGDYLMQRLVQGDVGSGKTVVAFDAMIFAAENGYQSAIMAPTDVLARQHYDKLTALINENGFDFPVVLLTGSLKAAERREAYSVIENSPNALIVGTNALIQEKVRYNNLALVVTDEQHRFGVKQREAFSDKGKDPHILVMSATPIPRTLAIILYGNLDISVIDEVPAVRKPIKNCVIGDSKRRTAYNFIEKEVRNGHQAYIICPLVESSENSEGQNVVDYGEYLKNILPEDIRVAILHGKMKPDEKNSIMEAYLRKDIDILVSTTVIEVGVDVPNATVMMIENAERFGLAQLHQLRGRVGRGDAQSYCILMNGDESKPNQRLETLNHSNDGFYIASQDLKMRGPGDFFGIRQSGDFQFKVADVFQDANILKAAAAEVAEILKYDPELQLEGNQNLRNRIQYYTQHENLVI